MELTTLARGRLPLRIQEPTAAPLLLPPRLRPRSPPSPPRPSPAHPGQPAGRRPPAGEKNASGRIRLTPRFPSAAKFKIRFVERQVAEGVAADIIGHDKPTITYGVYSGGASLSVKREAIKKINYPTH